MNRIAIDIDEVLVPLLDPLARFHRKPLPPRGVKHPYVFREVFNCTEAESQGMLREFYDSRDFLELRPIRDSQLALSRLSRNNVIYAVTGRQDWVRRKTEVWLNMHFPGVFKDVVLTNSYTPNEISKAQVCRALNLKVIIDDNYDVCLECFKNGVDVINFVGDPVYPWCEEENGISIKSWSELIIR